VKIAFTENLDTFNFKETKEKVKNYFMDLEKIQWEQARLNAERGIIAKYEFAPEDKNQAYVGTGKDEFRLSAKAEKDGELQKHLSGYHWAKSILTKQEQLYIIEYFVNGKYEDEVVGLLGLRNSDSRAFRKIKHRAIYKFAYVLNLVV